MTTRFTNWSIRFLSIASMCAALAISALPASAQNNQDNGRVRDVEPILECVSNLGRGQFSALFGYTNPNSFEVAIPLGWPNGFSPSPQERGQPTTFKPGRQVGVFAVPFDDTPITWTLNGRIVEATRTSPPCITPTVNPTNTVKPTETRKPTETSKPTETRKPSETARPIETPKPTETRPPSTATSPPTLTAQSGNDKVRNISPNVECIANAGGGVYIAYFTYDNKNDSIVTAPVGEQNLVSPGARDQGQPTTFKAGVDAVSAFQAKFDGSELTWTVGNKKATASVKKDKVCAATATPVATATTAATATPIATSTQASTATSVATTTPTRTTTPTITPTILSAITGSVSPASVTAPGDFVTIKWSTNRTLLTTDWFAIALVSSPDNEFADWRWINCSNGADAPNATAITGSCDLRLGALESGRYQVRFFSDNSDLRIGASEAFSVTASPITVSAAPSAVQTGGIATVTWSGISNASGLDWIGLYKTNNPGAAPVDWTWINCSRTSGAAVANGNCAFTIGAISSGDYVFKFFANNSTTVIGTSPAITVSAPSTTVSAQPTMVVAPNPVTVTWTNLPNALPLDWIGLYPAGNAQAGSAAWNWINCSKTPGNAVPSGSCAFPMTDIAAGTYEFRVFANNSSTVVSTSTAFTVSLAALTLSVSPATISGGSGQVALTWSDLPSPTGLDWIGLYVAGNAQSAALDWNWVSCAKTAGGPQPSGSCQWTLTNLPTGNYEFRFFANNSTTLIGTTSAISVTNAAPAPTATPTLSIVAAPASVVVPGGIVTVTWSNISSVASPGWLDWVAIYPSGNAQAAPVDWNWINCTRIPTSGINAGSCSFTLGSIPSGSYEFRIMSNNSATVLGTSNSFVIGP